MKRHVEYKCYIDSIQLRIEDIGTEVLFKEKYLTEINDRYEIVHRDKSSFRKVFTIRTFTNHKTKEQHLLISFNGFIKYDTFRDGLIQRDFFKVIDTLLSNDIKFYLNKIDLAIDFKDINFTDLYVQRAKYTGVQKKISNLDATTLNKIIENKESFYLEKTSSKKNSSQRIYIYHKTIKEKNNGNTTIKDDIYRVEAELVNFNKIKKQYDKNISNIELELLSIEFDNRRNKKADEYKLLQLEISKKQYQQEFNVALLQEIKSRFDKYEIKYKDKCITFDYSIVEDILVLCKNL
ncbi:MAG: hypothetical protein WBF48_03185 [Halarcobacter sp.]